MQKERGGGVSGPNKVCLFVFFLIFLSLLLFFFFFLIWYIQLCYFLELNLQGNPTARSASTLNCDFEWFLNRTLGRNVQEDGLNISQLIVTMKRSMQGVWSCYLSYTVQLADIKEKKEKKIGCLRDSIPGPLELQSNALPTELRGLWLQVNSQKLYLYLGWRGVT